MTKIRRCHPPSRLLLLCRPSQPPSSFCVSSMLLLSLLPLLLFLFHFLAPVFVLFFLSLSSMSLRLPPYVSVYHPLSVYLFVPLTLSSSPCYLDFTGTHLSQPPSLSLILVTPPVSFCATTFTVSPSATTNAPLCHHHPLSALLPLHRLLIESAFISC